MRVAYFNGFTRCNAILCSKRALSYGVFTRRVLIKSKELHRVCNEIFFHFNGITLFSSNFVNCYLFVYSVSRLLFNSSHPIFNSESIFPSTNIVERRKLSLLVAISRTVISVSRRGIRSPVDFRRKTTVDE